MPATLDEHYSYLIDRTKLERYQAAIEQAVEPGSAVLDLGCGSGLLGLIALRTGASKVLFVDESPIIEVARRTVKEAGFSDRAEFFQANSFDLSLPEHVDIVVCDHIGYFGFDYGVLSMLSDARQRFLKADGIVIPSEIVLMLAPVESESCRTIVSRWQSEAVPEDFHWVRAPAANATHAVDLGADELISDAADLGTMVLGEEVDDFLSWNAEFIADRDATLDGILGWFDCTLTGGIRMSNSPLVDDALDRPQAFLPLEQPVAVTKGERICATIMARHLDHVIAWVVELPEQGQRFALTTFNGLLIDNSALGRCKPDRIAQLNSRGLARQIILSYCDGNRTVVEIEALIENAHSDLFPSAQATRSFIRAVLAADTGE